MNSIFLKKEDSSIREKDLLFSYHPNVEKDRLYGRRRSHPLRERQQRLLTQFLPRLKFPTSAFNSPEKAFNRLPDQIWLEVGFGGGEHSLAQCKNHPDIGYIACEVFENGICSLLSHLVSCDQEENSAPIPEMLRIWNEDARLLIKNLPEHSINRLFLLFPDPWPKARHSKRRFVHKDRLSLVAHILHPDAHWYIASDDPTYQQWVETVMNDQPYFELVSKKTVRPLDWPPTRYEQKALKAGRQPFYWVFKKR